MQNTKKAPEKAAVAPDLDLWRRMLLITDLLRRVVKKGADNERLSRITVNQARIFGYIFSHEETGDIRISSLAHDLGVTPAAAGQAVDRLVRIGLVDRSIDPTDRRALVVSISETGRAHLRGFEDRSRIVSDEVLADVSPADIAAFDRVLGVLYDGLAARWNAILAARDAGAPPSPPAEQKSASSQNNLHHLTGEVGRFFQL